MCIRDSNVIVWTLKQIVDSIIYKKTMKGLEQLEAYCAAKNRKEASSQLPLVSRVDLLHDLYRQIKALDKKALGAVKKRVVAVLESLSNESAGAMLTRIIAKVHEELFALVDKSLLPQFFNKEIQVIGSGKVESSLKM
eukprot:TRINITY_DN16454_c0_g1_i1.p2 TRINITY_DN16454_c0_g1~~TRINITY_DN16454_c0_g1_i1.p2  ORF type:complete len:138 (-),score=53.81 TRINITY_DN16454_c0_g1_i1:647-1060(-)